MKNARRMAALALVTTLWLSLMPAMIPTAAGGEAHIWLDCDPGERAHGGGWQAGGIVCVPGPYGSDVTLEFDLIVTNRDNADAQTDLRIAMAIHSLNPPTTTDDFAGMTINGEPFALADFDASEYNPFDEAYGGKHHVYVGDDAVWAIYHYPDDLPPEETVVLPVEVTLGGNPSVGFEIHFDAFDMDTGAKTPNGHDVTLISGEEGPSPGEGVPVACIMGGDAIVVYEGQPVTFDGSCSSDPDGVIVAFEWDFDLDLDSDKDGNPANDIMSSGVETTFTWFDDYETDVSLTVMDNDGLTGSAIQTVTVLNVAPDGSLDGVFADYELGLRVAGEKWHNVNLNVYLNYDPDTGTWEKLVGSLEVERWPGSPSENPTAGGPTIPVRIDVTGTDTYTAVITYDPYADEGDAILGDQPINGQLWGDNPVWLVFTFSDGSTCRIKHNFNVQQSIERNRSIPELFAEPWIVELGGAGTACMPLEFVASASEPGSDDLTFVWDFGDGEMVTTMYPYDPSRADPAFPPGSPYEPYEGGVVPPLGVVDTVFHTYQNPGTYTVTLTIFDDDGGSYVLTFDLTIFPDIGCK